MPAHGEQMMNACTDDDTNACALLHQQELEDELANLNARLQQYSSNVEAFRRQLAVLRMDLVCYWLGVRGSISGTLLGTNCTPALYSGRSAVMMPLEFRRPHRLNILRVRDVLNIVFTRLLCWQIRAQGELKDIACKAHQLFRSSSSSCWTNNPEHLLRANKQVYMGLVSS